MNISPSTESVSTTNMTVNGTWNHTNPTGTRVHKASLWLQL